MSQELIKVNNNPLAHLFKNQSAVTESFSAGISETSFLPRVSIKGREFRIIVSGKETRLDSRHLDVVLVVARPNLTKTYYEDDYVSGDNRAPDCSSKNGKTPDEGVKKPQAASCALCPQNAWGSKLTKQGKKAKACSDSKLLIISPATQLGKPFALSVPATSLKALAAYMRQLEMSGLPANGVITRIKFADAEYPQLEFEFKQVLPDEESYFKVLETAQLPEVIEAVGENLVSKPSVRASEQPVQIETNRKKDATAPFAIEHAIDAEPVEDGEDARTPDEISHIVSLWTNK